MSREPMIQAQGLSKRYKLGQREGYKTLRDEIMARLPWGDGRLPSPKGGGQDASLQGSGRIEREGTKGYLWAVRDVSFEVDTGEVVGVVGRNGAGKSTLLKLLSRITWPTEGEARLRGRVGSLLEVGTGFHPELTGRENVYMNGSILGMSRREISSKYQDIVNFAEVTDFIDTPVKFYSSGMKVRLAFAVAAHLEPEVLLIDEVLSVGDAAFQKKCIGKMDSVADSGRTVLFVSHNMGAVSSLCERVIHLEGGRVVADGPTHEVVDGYLEATLDRVNQKSLREREDRGGDGRLRFTALRWEGADGTEEPTLRSGGDYRLALEYEKQDNRPIKDAVVSFAVKDQLGTIVLLHQSIFEGKTFTDVPEAGQFVCKLENLPLAEGLYTINIYAGRESHPYDVLNDAAQFSVEFGDFFGTGSPGKPDLCRVLLEGYWGIEE